MIRSFVPAARWLIVLFVITAALLGPVAAAYGQTPAAAQYQQSLGENAHGGPAGGSSTLPFTGLNLVGVAGAGIVLIAAGTVLRRRTSRTSG